MISPNEVVPMKETYKIHERKMQQSRGFPGKQVFQVDKSGQDAWSRYWGGLEDLPLGTDKGRSQSQAVGRKQD